MSVYLFLLLNIKKNNSIVTNWLYLSYSPYLYGGMTGTD